MQTQLFQTWDKCTNMLRESKDNFAKVEYLRLLVKVSSDQRNKKSSLFLYCLYCIIHKQDYVEALQGIQKAEKADESSLIIVSVSKLIRGLLYTWIDKHRDSLNLMKQAVGLLRSPEPMSSQMKNHYKRIIPVVIYNLNLSSGKKAFFKLFNQIYDQLAKQTSENQLNQQILYALHSKIQFLKNQMDHIPLVKLDDSRVSRQKRALIKQISQKVQNKSSYQPQSEYIGFSKPVSAQQKSIKNIKKMIQQKKSLKDTRGTDPFNKKPSNKIQLRNQLNPYQLNLYLDQKPQCQFL